MALVSRADSAVHAHMRWYFEWLRVGSEFTGTTAPDAVRGGSQILLDFLALADQDTSPDDVLAFARRWGVLQLCRHGQPHTHAPDCVPRGFTEDADGYLHGTGREPVADWQRYAREARAILKIAEHLRDGQPGDRADWSVVFTASPLLELYNETWAGMTGRYEDGPDLATDAALLSFVLNQWLTDGAVQYRFYWVTRRGADGRLTMGQPEQELGGESLFSLLAVRLVAAVVGGGGIAFCSACGRAYARDRRPARGRRDFCPDKCRGRIANRLAQRDRRQRLASA